GHPGGTEGAHLIHSVGAAHHPGPLHPEALQGAGQDRTERVVEGAEELVARPRGVGEGAEDVEDGPDPELLARRRHEAHGRAVGGASRGTPSSWSTSALPERLETARLPCFATGTPAAATIRAAPVDRFRLPRPSPPVPQVSRSTSKEWSTATMWSRRLRAAAAMTSGVSPLRRRATAKAAICVAVQVPVRIASNTAFTRAASASGAASSRAKASRKAMAVTSGSLGPGPTRVPQRAA